MQDVENSDLLVLSMQWRGFDDACRACVAALFVREVNLTDRPAIVRVFAGDYGRD